MEAGKYCGRFKEITPNEMTDAQQALIRQMMEGPRGRVPVPFRIWLSNSDIANCFEHLSNKVIRKSSLSAREREIVVLLAAKVMGSSYMASAHRRLAAQAGLTAEEIEAISGGMAPGLSDNRERTVFDLASTAFAHREVDDDLHERTVAALGHEGFCDLVGLLGFYFAVGVTLNFYAVPASA